MSIIVDQQQQIFHLKGKSISYIIKVNKYGHIEHCYFGQQIDTFQDDTDVLKYNRCSFSPNPVKEDLDYCSDILPSEYPSYGNADLRSPAFHIQSESGARITDLKYEKYEIIKGKRKLEGLPATYMEEETEGETLLLYLIDKVIGLKVIMAYSVFHNYDGIARSIQFINEGQDVLQIEKALSMNIDFNRCDFEVINLAGSWARERQIVRTPLGQHKFLVDSSRGASSHSQNPFIALVTPGTNEVYGEAYGFSLVYSGDFMAQVEVDQYHMTRVQMGLNSFDFNWRLETKECFQTPEVVMVYSNEGLGKMSRTYHKLYQNRLCRGQFKKEVRPVLINNWEATYFDFNEEKIIQLAKESQPLGIQLFVLDDGWFGKRNSDKTSLGDWFVNKEKLPHGISGLAEAIHKEKMAFGLWFEPEMVSPESELYSKHPEWCIKVPERSMSRGRNQYILDLGRKEVQDYIIKALSELLEIAPINYVKWDMNRNMTEIGSGILGRERQKETVHRYYLGLYRVLETLVTKYEKVLFESCSGGGGRFDPGMLYYMPQTWTSDDTDAIERLKIQYGTSLVYPLSSMGAHVAAVPNHQCHRITPLTTRQNVATFGNLGYELDVTQMTEEEKESMKQHIAYYKEIAHTVQYGDFYRLLSPFEGNDTAWLVVNEEKEQAVVGYYQTLATPNPFAKRLKLQGLDATKYYEVFNQLTQKTTIYQGTQLLNVGLPIPELQGDFASIVWTLKVRDKR